MAERFEIVAKALRKMLEEKKYPALRDILLVMNPSDIAELFLDLEPHQIPLLFRLLPKEQAAETFVEMGVQPGAKTTASVGAGDVTMRSDMALQAQVTSRQGLEMLTGLQLGETTEPDPNRPSLILTRVGDRSLWQIAKESGSTVEAIWQTNHLQSQPDESQMLLIPVM